ncbi:hypothetical protein JCM11251_003448 [Rhodosporidiobolus azoricus]
MLISFSIVACIAAGAVSASPVAKVARADPVTAPVESNSPAAVETYVKDGATFTRQGCYNDRTSDRALPTLLVTGKNSVDGCLDACAQKAYAYCGVEYHGECWAGDELKSYSVKQDDSLCNLKCWDNDKQLCGGTGGPDGATFQVYKRSATPGYVTPTTTTTPPAPTPTLTTLSSYAKDGNVYTNSGCYSDLKDGQRAFSNLLSFGQKNSVEGCLEQCSKKDYDFCGVEYHGECWGGNSVASWSAKQDDGACALECWDQPGQRCGGVGGPTRATFQLFTRGNVPGYVSPAPPAPTATRLASYSANGAIFSRQGCFNDLDSNRRALPNLLWNKSKNDVESCLTACAKEGYSLCGVEYHGECWGANEKAEWSKKVDDSVCNLECWDNTKQVSPSAPPPPPFFLLTSFMYFFQLCGGTGGPTGAAYQLYQAAKCPTNAATCSSSTVATSCNTGFVLSVGKCVSGCASNEYADSTGACKLCTERDPNSLTCTAEKSLTCGRNRMIIEATGVCTTTSNCPYQPTFTGTNFTPVVPGSYNNLQGTCVSCAYGAFQCRATGAQFCYNPAGVQYYLRGGMCLTKDECQAVNPTSRLTTARQTSTGVTYGTC